MQHSQNESSTIELKGYMKAIQKTKSKPAIYPFGLKETHFLNYLAENKCFCVKKLKYY